MSNTTVRRSVLVADDAASSRRLAGWLQGLGHDVVRAQGIEDALSCARRGVVLVIVEVAFDSLPPWEALRRLRAVTTAPAIVVTVAEDDNVLRAEAFALGAQGLLKKPLAKASFLLLAGQLLAP